MEKFYIFRAVCFSEPSLEFGTVKINLSIYIDKCALPVAKKHRKPLPITVSHNPREGAITFCYTDCFECSAGIW